MAAFIASPLSAASRQWGARIAWVGRSPGSEYRTLLAAGPLVAGIVGGMALNLGPVTSVAAIGAILAAVASPAVGLATLAFMAPLKPPPAIPAPGFNTVLVGAILLGCIYRLPIDRPRLRVSAPLLVLLAFILYVAVQQLPDMLMGWTGEEGHLVGFQFVQLLTGFGAVLAAGYVLSNRSPYSVLAMAMAGAALAATIALVMFRGTFGPFVNLTVQSTDGTRALGPFGNPNYLGVFIAIGIAAAVGLQVGVRTRLARIVLIGTAMLLAGALAVSLSRGALVAAATGLAVLALSLSRRLGVLVIVLGAFAAVVVYPAFIQWRLISETGSASAAAYAATALSDSGRLTAVLAAPLIFLSSPITGVGFGHYAQMSVQVGGALSPIDAHNWYLNVLAEEGTVGIALWMLLLITLVVALSTRPPAARALGYAVLAALAAGSLFLEPPTSFQTMAVPAILLVAALVSDWALQPEVQIDPILTIRLAFERGPRTPSRRSSGSRWRPASGPGSQSPQSPSRGAD